MRPPIADDPPPPCESTTHAPGPRLAGVDLDASWHIVAVCCLIEDELSLLFTGPEPLEESLGEAKARALRQQLELERRFHKVTIKMLADFGVASFCWIHPNESFNGIDGSRWEHGAFLYQYAEAESHLDCFFSVCRSVRAGEVGRVGRAAGTCVGNACHADATCVHLVRAGQRIWRKQLGPAHWADARRSARQERRRAAGRRSSPARHGDDHANAPRSSSGVVRRRER